MRSRSRLLALLSIFLLCAMLVPSASAAQNGQVSAGEFRDKFTQYMAWLDSHTSYALNMTGRVEAMNDEEFQALYDSFADPGAFITQAENVMAITFQPQAELSAGTLAASNVAVMPSLFQPAYPSGSVYDAWVASLPLSSLLTDADGDGSTADDRCSTDGEAGIRLLTATLSAALIPQDLGCTLLPAPTNVINCTAASVISGSILANDILLSQCTDQDGLVDAAEIEAAYENSKIISGQVYAVASQIDTIRDGITTIQVTLEANHTEVMETMAANHTEVMDTMAANQAQSLKIEIERALRDTNDGKRLSYFYLPEAYGGLLELVRETVWDAINANQAAGLSTGGAQSWFDRAEASFQRSDFKNAFDQYAKAYQETIK